MTLAFRIKCRLANGEKISVAGVFDVELPRFFTGNGFEVSLERPSEGQFGGAEEFYLVSTGYPTLEDARANAKEVMARIQIGSVLAEMAVEFSKAESVHGRVENPDLTHGSTEVQAIQQFEGVTFFRNDLTPRFMEMSGQVFNIRPASFLMNRFIAVPSHLDEKTILAAELYCAAQFETSLRAKFLTLVTAVEQLAERHNRSDEEIDLVDSLLRLVENSGLNPDQKNKLMSACGGLKKRSIADGVTLLVEKHLGPEEVASFATAHKLRNKLSHAGVGEGLQVQVCNVQGVVKKLIASLVKDAIGNAKS